MAHGRFDRLAPASIRKVIGVTSGILDAAVWAGLLEPTRPGVCNCPASSTPKPASSPSNWTASRLPSQTCRLTEPIRPVPVVATSLVWYELTRTGWVRRTIEPDLLQLEACGGFADIDGDGDLDLVIGEDLQGKHVWWWENPAPHFGSRRIRREIRSSDR